MRYKLYKDIIPQYSALQQILYNRGVPEDKQSVWLDAGWNEINSWNSFTSNDDDKNDMMTYAVNLVHSAIENDEDVQIVVDSDCDGYTSSAIITNYLYTLYPEWTHFHLKHIMHKGKEHGLSDVMDLILRDTKLVIIPDAGSNDIKEHQILEEKGINVLVLDHHEISSDISNSPAFIINVQSSSYPNKALTGAGVAWQFCRAFDDLYPSEIDNLPHANDFIDLAALGNCGDMADYRELEIRALINLGFSNIKNPFFFSMVKKNNFSIQKMNGINYLSAAFYVVPFINATVRSGTMEEKEIVFNSMLLEYAFDDVESSKRGEKGKLVPLYQEAITIAERVKRRQTKLQNEAIELFDNKIKENNLLDNSILLFLCQPGEVEKTIAGLIANKEQAKYQKPCLVLTKTKTIDDDQYYYRGSARNYSLSEKDNLKKEIDLTGCAEYTAGHANAFGVSIAEKDIDNFIKAFNNQYKDVDQTPTYWVDYIWNSNTINPSKILDIGGLNIYGQEIPESLIAIENISLDPSMITLMSADKNPTLKIMIGNVSIIKFKSSQEEYQEFCGDNKVLNAICKCQINEWNGNIFPQLIIEDFKLREEWIF